MSDKLRSSVDRAVAATPAAGRWDQHCVPAAVEMSRQGLARGERAVDGRAGDQGTVRCAQRGGPGTPGPGAEVVAPTVY